jgi:high-affinity Fe2+/Pb2+ permease
VNINLLVALMLPLISTAITPNKIIAGVVLLIVILALVAWYMSRRRGPS